MELRRAATSLLPLLRLLDRGWRGLLTECLQAREERFGLLELPQLVDDQPLGADEEHIGDTLYSEGLGKLRVLVEVLRV